MNDAAGGAASRACDYGFDHDVSSKRFRHMVFEIACFGHGGLFSSWQPSPQRLWNGTTFLHIWQQPTEQAFQSGGSRMCLSGDPFVPTMGATKGSGVFWLAALKRDPHGQYRSYSLTFKNLEGIWSQATLFIYKSP
jgi:hypothetical protein